MIRFLAQTDKLEDLIVPDSVKKAKVVETIEKISSVDFHELMNKFIQEAIWVAIEIAVALVIYFVGRWLIHRLERWFDAVLVRREVSESTRPFLRNLVRTCAWILLIVTIIAWLGINMSALVALFASAGLAIGMALSGTLQNFAGGIMIIVLKPYKIGDYISALNVEGTVREIMLFSTKITTADNKTIYIPNSSISSGIINNFSTQVNRRVDWKVSISYGDDVDKAKETVAAIIRSDERVLLTPASFIGVHALSESSVDITARAWVASGDYWDVFFDINERIYKELPAAGLHFPFPQVDVHVDSPKALAASDERK